MDDKQLAKLIRKNMEKAAANSSRLRPKKSYDPTAPDRDEDEAGAERTQLFKDMKKREF